MLRGYLCRFRPELRMPRAELWPVGAGFRSEGPVMSGLMSVEEAHARANAAAFIDQARGRGFRRAPAPSRAARVE